MRASELGDGVALILALGAIAGDEEAIAAIGDLEPEPRDITASERQ